MGKGNLILGTGRGKLGDAVFYRTGGEQRFRVRVRPTNPQTNAQLLQRVVVSTAVKAYSELAYVCDHAFQNFEGKLKNHQRFMKLNIKKFREIALMNIEAWSPLRFDSVNIGNWSIKDSSIPLLNEYIISEGDLQSVELESMNFKSERFNRIVLWGGKTAPTSLTYREFCLYYNLQPGDQLTFIFVYSKDNGEMLRTYFSRIILMPSNGDMDTPMFKAKQGVEGYGLEINNPNKENYGNLDFLTFPDTGVEDLGYIVIRPDADVDIIQNIKGWGVITSRYENGYWRRSSSSLKVEENYMNINTLQDAMVSYLKVNSSSLYLNQANKENDLEQVSYGEQNYIDKNQEIEVYEKNSKKSGKKSE